MDIFLNYIFTGVIFSFFIDMLLNLESVKNHPKMKNKIWGLNERLLCIFIWPIAAAIYFYTLIKLWIKK